MSIIVQSALVSTSVNLLHGLTTTVTVSAAFINPVAAGNSIVAIGQLTPNSAINTGVGVQVTHNQGFSDSQSNAYSQICWAQGGAQIQAAGSFLAANVVAGATTVTFTIQCPNANPIFDLLSDMSILIIELAEVPSVQDSAIQANSVGAGAMNLTITDSQSNTVTSGFGSPNQQTGMVFDLAASGSDLMIASLTAAPLSIPTVSPGGYGSYAVIESNSKLTAWYIFHASAPVITCDSPPTGSVGTPYTHTFPVTGGTAPFTFAITSGSLPGGLTLNTSTGVVSGTPTTQGTFPFTIQVTDANALTSSVACSISITGTLSIICNSPPNGTVGTPYSHAFPASGGTPPYSFAIISGALPTGVTLNTSTGVASGTPTVPGIFSFTVQVTDALAATASVGCSITISAAAPVITCGSPPSGTVGVAYTHTFPVTSGTAPFTFTITAGALPTGLSLNASTGQVTGTPTLAGGFSFTVQVTDSNSLSSSVPCSIVIVGNAPTISCGSPPAGTVGFLYSHIFPVSGGTPPFTFSITAGSLPPGLFLNIATGAVFGTPTTAGVYAFTVRVIDTLSQAGTVDCSISIAANNPIILCGPAPDGIVGVPYSHTIVVTGGVPPYTFSITSGVLPTGLILNSLTGLIAGTPTAQGVFPFTVSVTDTFGHVSAPCSITITVVIPLSIICNNPPAGTVGVPYSHAFPATGGTPPYTFAITAGALPAGLTLNTSTGVVSGTPTLAGSSFFTIQVTDAVSATSSVTCGITISGGLAIGCGNPPTGTVGVPYFHTFPVTGGTAPYSFSITSGALPPGLSLNPFTGQVTGTPTTSGGYGFTVTVTDAASASASVGCGIGINTVPPAVSVFCNNPPPGGIGEPYSHTFLALNGTPPYTFSISAGSLPPGLSLSASGTVTGIIATGGIYSFTVHVVDAAFGQASVNCTIAVIGACPCCLPAQRESGSPVVPARQPQSITSIPQPPGSWFSSEDGSIQGAIDGRNAVFTVGLMCQRFRVWKNGVLQTLNANVVASGNTVKFLDTAPPNGRTDRIPHPNYPQLGDILLFQGWPL